MLPERTRHWIRIRRLAAQEFLQTEASGGVVLLVATVAALIWANSPWASGYVSFWHTKIGPESLHLREDLQHWVNDALMVIFFLVVGLEIKRELAKGELRDPRKAALPAIAALGGMVGPALVYLAFASSGDAGRGWGIPMATDIAFVVGVLAVMGRRAPSGLKLFLLTLAIVDDIGAILVIAVFYSESIAAGWLGVALAGFAGVAVLRIFRVPWAVAYVPLGIVIWYGTFRSGLHPTIAGVALGLFTPAGEVRDRPALEILEHRLHPWSSYVVVPIFALANAGVALTSEALRDAVSSRVFWGVGLGLVVGKIVGICGATALTLWTKIGRLPSDLSWQHVVGGSALAGIGFTVSLFITGLAFVSDELTDVAKIGVLAGSVVAAIVGATVLSRTRSRQDARDRDAEQTP